MSSEGDVELSLGLTLGGRNNGNKKYSNSQSLMANVVVSTDFSGIFCGEDFYSASRKRQMEAKKDHIESQRMLKKRQKLDDRRHHHRHHQAETTPNSNPNLKINLIPNHNPNSNVTVNMIPNPSATSTSANVSADESDQATVLPPYNHFPVMPMQYSYPYANGFGFSYMVPWYMNVSSSGQDGAMSGRNMFQPVPTRSFHTFQGIAGKEVLQSGGEEGGCGGSINRSHSMTGSQGSSLSAVSEFQSLSQQQGL